MGQDTKFTPGPWVAIRSIPQEGYDGWYLRAQPNSAMRGFTKEIGWVNGSDENEANAHLISAAPDMFEALGAVLANHAYFAPAGNKNCRFCDNDLDHEGTFRDMHSPDCVVHIIRAARAKAKGE